jgi:hypothetical protein
MNEGINLILSELSSVACAYALTNEVSQMKKNIAIAVLAILVGLYFFDIIGNDQKEPELVNNNIIKFHSYSLHNVEGGLFKINHDTGEAYMYQGGAFLPVPTITTNQIMQMQQGQPTGRDRANQLLEQYD